MTQSKELSPIPSRNPTRSKFLKSVNNPNNNMEQNGGQLLHVLLPIELSAVTRKHRICNAVATVHGCLGSVDTEILVDSGSSA